MKKVLSVAMASAMVLGMGANAFAIQYASGSSDTAAWPAGFQFDGKMFVTNKDGDIVTGSNTKLDGKTRINFNEGDTIWMPLYANNQKEYTVVGDQVGLPAVAAGEVIFNPVLDKLPVEEELVSINHKTGKVNPFEYRDNQNKVLYWYNDAVTAKAPSLTPAEEKAGWRTARIVDYKDNYGKVQHGVKVMLNGAEVTTIAAMTTNETTNVPVVGDLKVLALAYDRKVPSARGDGLSVNFLHSSAEDYRVAFDRIEKHVRQSSDLLSCDRFHRVTFSCEHDSYGAHVRD